MYGCHIQRPICIIHHKKQFLQLCFTLHGMHISLGHYQNCKTKFTSNFCFFFPKSHHCPYLYVKQIILTHICCSIRKPVLQINCKILSLCGNKNGIIGAIVLDIYELKETKPAYLFSSESGWMDKNFPGTVSAAHMHNTNPRSNSITTWISRNKIKRLKQARRKFKKLFEGKNGKENPAVLTFIGGLENSSSMIFNKPLSATKSNQFKLNKFFFCLNKNQFKSQNIKLVGRLGNYTELLNKRRERELKLQALQQWNLNPFFKFRFSDSFYKISEDPRIVVLARSSRWKLQSRTWTTWLA